MEVRINVRLILVKTMDAKGCLPRGNIDQYRPSHLYELECSEHRAAAIPLRFKFVPLEFRREIRRRVSFLREFD